MRFIKLIIFILLALLSAADARSLDSEILRVFGQDSYKVKDDVTCQDCIHIFEILKHLLSDQNLQMKVKNNLETFCENLPPEISKLCQNYVETNFPLAITLISSLLVPDQLCVYFNLCEDEIQTKMKMEDNFISHVQKTFTVPDVKLDSSIPCSACMYVLNILDCAVPRAQTESAVMAALGEACALLPLIFRGQCSRLTQKYVKMLFEVLLNPASPNSICSTLRLCQLPAMPSNRATSLVSDCDSCLTMTVLARLSLGSNATLPHRTAFLQYFCQSHPDALSECESFIQRHGRQLESILGKDGDALDLCETAALCVGREHEDGMRSMEEIGDRGDPCTLGPRYTCRDLYTAQSCGVVSYCQKNIWK